MRYRYNDLDKTERLYYQDRLKFSINGECIDDKLPFFYTLNVYGRELVARDIATKNYSTTTSGGKSRYGKNKYSTSIKNAFIGSTLGQRQLTVQYRLISKTESEMIENYSKLQFYINQEQAKLSFSDDSNYYYEGTFTGFEEVKSEKLDIIGKLTFECIDPYKYTFKSFNKSFTNSTTFTCNSKYKVLLEEITLLPNSSSGYVEIANSTSANKIKILNKYSDKVIINCIQNTVKDSTNRNRMSDVDIFSDLEDFEILNGDRLSVTGASSCSIKYKERGL